MREADTGFVMDASPIGYACFGAPQCNCIQKNPAFLTLAGADPDNGLRGEPFSRWAQTGCALAHSGGSASFIARLNGRSLIVSLSSPQRGRFAVFLTEMPAAENTPVQRDYYRDLVENIDAVFFIRDRENFRYVSPSYEKFWGKACQSLYEDPGSFFESIHEDDRQMMWASFRQSALQNTETKYNEEFRLCTPTGTRWMWLRTYPVCEKGQLVAKAGIVMDISAIKKLEAALKESEAQLILAQKLAKTGSWKRDLRTNIYHLSQECRDIFGITQQAEDIPFEMVFGLIFPDDRGAVLRIIHESIRRRKPYDAEFRILTPQGELRHLVMRSQLLDGETGEPAFSFGTVQDVTDRKLYEDQLTTARNAAVNLNRVLAENEKKYHMLFETMRGGFALCEAAPPARDYRILEVNPAFERLTGLRAANVAGKMAEETDPALQQLWETYSDRPNGQPAVYARNNGTENKLFEVYTFEAGGSRLASIFNDITERRRMESIIYAEKERLQITLESIGEGVICTDPLGRVEMVNRAGEALIGRQSSEAVGRPLDEVLELYDEQTGRRCPSPVQKVIETRSVVSVPENAVLRLPDGTRRSVADSAAPVIDSSGKILGTVLVLRDVTSEKRHYEKINYLNNHDMLTGLSNRSFLENEIKRLTQEKTCPVAVVMGDVNGLKMINDVFGHAQGDHLLQVVADILKHSVRKCDIVARTGGDEFVILLPGADMQTAAQICDRVKKACEQYPRQQKDYNTFPSIALGYAVKTVPSETFDNLMRVAENFMYRNKLIGSRNTRRLIIGAMRKTLAADDLDAEAQAERLRRLCGGIANEMGLHEKDKNDLDLFASLHDIGNITIDSAVLKKPGSLDDEEWEQVRKHPETGFHILNSAPEFASIAEYVLTHHERWDGSGYPQGLKGKEIPLLSRIFAVADTYVSMTRSRYYRDTLQKEVALANIRADTGVKYDPDVVRAFERALSHAEY